MEFAPIYIAVLLVVLIVASAVLYRRLLSRRALVQRVTDLTVLAEIGRAIANAPLDLTGLAEVVFAQASQIVDTSIFQLGLFEGDRYRLLIRVLDGQREPVSAFRLTPDSLGIVGWMRDSRRSLIVGDFEAERETLPAQPRYLSENPPHSAVFVPLIAGEVVLGAIAIQSRRRLAFNEEHLRLLTIVANHAAAALEKAKVYEQAGQRAAQLELLSQVSKQINVLQPLSALYRQVVELVATKFDTYEVSFFEQTVEFLLLRATTVPEWQGKSVAISSDERNSLIAEAAAFRKSVTHDELPDGETMTTAETEPSPEGLSQLAVPVVIEEKVMGVLNVRCRTIAFDQNTVDLFESLAAQMAFAILESQIYAAEQRRADQLATIAQVSRTIVSALELEELFDEVLDRVEDSFGYKRAHIFLLQDDRLIFRAGIGRGAARWLVRGQSYDLKGPGIIPLVGRARQALVVGDITAHPQYLPGVGLDDTLSQMAAPLLMGESLLGVFDVQSDKVDHFSDDDLQILQTLADTLAVAVRNARLFDIERRRRYLAETMREVSAGLTSTLNLDNVLDLILSGLERVVTFDAASILLANEAGEVVLRAIRGLPELQEVVGDVLDVRLFSSGGELLSLVNFEEVDYRHEYHDLLSLPEPHACLAAVLALRSEHIGYLVVDRGGDTRFQASEEELISTFASQASVAIENARLYTAQLEQAWVSTALLQVAEATTRAAELDEVIQTVARLTPMLVGVERCAVLLADGDGFVVKAFYSQQGSPPQLDTFPPFLPHDWPKLYELVTTREPVVIMSEQLGGELPLELRQWFSDVVILLPLLAKGSVEGVLAIGQTYGESPFNTHRIQLLSGIANQAAVALESAMLYESQQEEAWVSAALLQVAEAVAQPGSLDEALEAVARLTPMLAGIERVVIYQWDSGPSVFRFSQSEGLDKSAEAELEQAPISAHDLGIDPVLGPAHPIFEFRLSPFLATHTGFETAMIWPLQARGDLLGALMMQYVPVPKLGRRLSILDGIAHQLSLAIENARLVRELAQQQRLERDIELARDIQASFLPESCPVVPGWELCSYWEAARQVGGDFYDFIRLRSHDGMERWGIVIADVADKGVAAALFMALSRTLMRTVAISRVSPAATLARVNDLIFADSKTDLFVTIFYAVWEPASGRFVYVSAGHNPPVWTGHNRAADVLPGRGVPIGVFEQVEYAEHEIQIGCGDALLLYTDGVPDAINTTNHEFGIDRVKEVLGDSYTKGASEIMDEVVNAVHAHVGMAEAFDDMTMVVLKRQP